MREYVAKAFVLVALGSAGSSELAAATLPQDTIVNSAAGAVVAKSVDARYWSAQSEYFLNDTGRIATGLGHSSHHVLITGYHPLKGFEAETAAEATARARSGR